ncbi:MAG: DinB family protein [Chloroflexi bacterium]|nr:DinB family protein [Chloroflexota bacterium]
MLLEALHTLFAYNRLATQRVLDAAELLTPEQWLAPQTAGRGPIRDTLVHVVSSQRRWLAAGAGSLPPQDTSWGLVEPADFPDVAAVRALFQTVDEETQRFLETLTDPMLEQVRVRRTPSGNEFRCLLWQMLLHAANHGTQHRSEVAAMLTAFGHSPGDLDLLRFLPASETPVGG